eukprot:m.116132 g.116132  ORF g.116132 m.116132 type:complete len:462 (-) comp13595_c0_seq1:275-1660(-)
MPKMDSTADAPTTPPPAEESTSPAPAPALSESDDTTPEPAKKAGGRGRLSLSSKGGAKRRSPAKNSTKKAQGVEKENQQEQAPAALGQEESATKVEEDAEDADETAPKSPKAADPKDPEDLEEEKEETRDEAVADEEIATEETTEEKQSKAPPVAVRSTGSRKKASPTKPKSKSKSPRKSKKTKGDKGDMNDSEDEEGEVSEAALEEEMKRAMAEADKPSQVEEDEEEEDYDEDDILPTPKRKPSTDGNGSASEADADSPRKKSPVHVRRLGEVTLSRLSEEDEEMVESALESLGGFKYSDALTPTTTHVINSGKRTAKVLEGIAHGCWIVSPKWVVDSVAANKWLPEQEYVLSDEFPALKDWDARKPCTPFLRDTTVAAFIPDDVRHDLVIRLCRHLGATVTLQPWRASICLIDELDTQEVPDFKTDAATKLSVRWLFDSVSKHQRLPFEEPYLISGASA